MKESPKLITHLRDDEIFVFGSNLAGIHGAGAARLAHQRFGAIWGIGNGMTGNSYAIPTKDYRIQTMELSDIAYYVEQFIKYTQLQGHFNKFLVTEIGCGLAGYKPEDIAPLFVKVKELDLDNIYLPEMFIEVLENGSKKINKKEKD